MALSTIVEKKKSQLACMSMLRTSTIGLYKTQRTKASQDGCFCRKNTTFLYPWCTLTSEYEYCGSLRDGRQTIELNGTKLEVICDGDWLVISRRLSDNSTQFFGNLEPDQRWGDLSGDFWLGTEAFHQLTSGPFKMELLIDIRLCNNQTVLQRVYKNFAVGNKLSGYRLTIDPNPDEDETEGLSGSQGTFISCSNIFAQQHAFSCWWWKRHSAVSINDEVGCDIPPPINNFWFTLEPQRRFQIKTVEMKIRPMEAVRSENKT